MLIQNILQVGHALFWIEMVPFLSFVIRWEKWGEKNRNQWFYNQDPKWKNLGFEPTKLTPLWLCEPENNLRTSYIQNHSARPSGKHRLDISQCHHICIKKDSGAVKRLTSLLWKLEWAETDGEILCHFSLDRTCRRVGFCSMMRTSSVSM